MKRVVSVKAFIMSYDTNIVKKRYYFDWELFGKFYRCKPAEIVFLGHSSTGHSVYSTPHGNMAIVSKMCDFNSETGRGSFKFRPYNGAVEKLNKKHVDQFQKDKEEFLESLKIEGSQLRVPEIKSFNSLPEAIAGYTSVVANSWGCNTEQHDQIIAFKKDLHSWIEAEGYV
jgi:hypothetical protein